MNSSLEFIKRTHTGVASKEELEKCEEENRREGEKRRRENRLAKLESFSSTKQISKS